MDMSMGLNMGVGMWIFWIVIIVLVLFVIRFILATSSDGESSAETAMDILEKRFARGEIDRQEYERIKNELKK